MSIADNLGMPITMIEPQTEESAEDRMLLQTNVRFLENGIWFSVWLTRQEVAKLLNDTNTIEGRPIFEISPVTVDGPECTMMYIYNYASQTWRLE